MLGTEMHAPSHARDRPLRVAHLTASLATGGKERTIADLCRTSSEHGLTAAVVTFESGTEPRKTVDVDPASIIALDRKVGRRRLATRLAEELQRHSIDVLHAHGHVAAIHASDVRHLVALPAIATLHIAAGSDWRWLLSIRRALRRMDRVVAVSMPMARSFARASGVRVAVVPTGVDLRRFSPDVTPTRPRPAGRFTVGMAGRFHPVKRHRDAFSAVQQLAGEGRSIRLLAATDSEASMLGSEFPRADIEVTGIIQDMSGFYASLDAFLLCSEDEGTPLALLEAMASGVPCLATQVGGIPDVVQAAGGACAILVPPRSPGALADGLRRMMDDPVLYSDLRMRSLARVQQYSLEAQASAYAALYRDIISAARLL